MVIIKMVKNKRSYLGYFEGVERIYYCDLEELMIRIV